MFRLFGALAVLAGFVLTADGAQVPTAAQTFPRWIYLVRHGAYDLGSSAPPNVEGSLTPLGVAQARLLAARFKSMDVRFDSITSSTLARARETAAVIHEQLVGVPVSQVASLVECPPPRLGMPPLDPTEQETACGATVDGVFSERFVPAAGSERHEIIVGHGNVIRYLVMKALQADSRHWTAMTLGNASLTVIRVEASGAMKVLAVGDVGHLPQNLQSLGNETDRQLVAPRAIQ